MPGEVLQIDDVGPALPGRRERRYAERVHGDGRIETAAASVALNEVLDGSHRERPLGKPVASASPRGEGGRKRGPPRSAAILPEAIHAFSRSTASTWSGTVRSLPPLPWSARTRCSLLVLKSSTRSIAPDILFLSEV